MDVSGLEKKLDKLRLSPESLYCDNEGAFSELLRRLESFSSDPDPMIFLEFQGKGLGSTDGDLSLLQIGLTSKTFIVDAIALDDHIPRLASFFQNRNIRKVVWDGRLGYSELWHRYAIRLENVLDLQLVYLHERFDVTQRKSIPLNGKLTAIKEKKLISQVAIEMQLDKRRHLSSDKWAERPLPSSHLDYASEQMSQLRMLATNLIPQAGHSANILRESKRYIELWHHRRRDIKSPYQIHNCLPQGIIERTEKERGWRSLGTRRCRGCERDLYQESYQVEFRRWTRNPEKQFCYTCAKVNLRRYRRNRFLDVLELAKSRTASPALIVGEAKV